MLILKNKAFWVLILSTIFTVLTNFGFVDLSGQVDNIASLFVQVVTLIIAFTETVKRQRG